MQSKLTGQLEFELQRGGWLEGGSTRGGEGVGGGGWFTGIWAAWGSGQQGGEHQGSGGTAAQQHGEAQEVLHGGGRGVRAAEHQGR